MTQSRTYTISSQRELSGDPGVANSRYEQHMTCPTPEPAARAALERATQHDEPVIITATHWQLEPLGTRNRLSAVKVCPNDNLHEIVEQIDALDRGDATHN